jgi:uncharacterized protein (TIGR00369 family)
MDFTALAGLVEDFFPFHRMLGIKAVEIAEGRVRLRIPFRPDLVGHHGDRPILHGGVISALVDVCGGFAVWTRCCLEDRLSTITLSVDYLRPAQACDLYAEATVRLLGNRVGNAHVLVWSAGSPDVVVAEGRGVYNIRRGTEC